MPLLAAMYRAAGGRGTQQRSEAQPPTSGDHPQHHPLRTTMSGVVRGAGTPLLLRCQLQDRASHRTVSEDRVRPADARRIDGQRKRRVARLGDERRRRPSGRRDLHHFVLKGAIAAVPPCRRCRCLRRTFGHRQLMPTADQAHTRRLVGRSRRNGDRRRRATRSRLRRFHRARCLEVRSLRWSLRPTRRPSAILRRRCRPRCSLPRAEIAPAFAWVRVALG